MKRKILRYVIPLATLGLSAVPAWAQMPVSVLTVQTIQDSSYCHMKFPAIREDTLSWDRPVLKDGSDSEGDLIDFYGPCDYDPLGKEQVQAQRADTRDSRDD